MRNTMTASRTLSASFLLATATALASACSTETRTVNLGREDPAPIFASPDAGDDAGSSSSDTLTSYCPSDRCPVGHTTCPNSPFRCDVDLRSDRNNCGECGNVCPPDAMAETYACVEGRCTLVCNGKFGYDCDGIPDNGCETPITSNDHCGACGQKCPTGKPCIDRGILDIGCGCRGNDLHCPGTYPPCVDAQSDDNNCGACGNICPEGDPSDLPPQTRLGCSEGTCGAIKCRNGFGDCDGFPANGCEASLFDNANCGVCGNQCPNGMECRISGTGFPMCMCPQGQTYCNQFCIGDLCGGYCADLTSDVTSCGACGNQCAYDSDVSNGAEACVYGKCTTKCEAGWGECNGNLADGCETNTAADPKNCGGCGKVCDGIAGQACVDGMCMVEPCDALRDAGEQAR